MLTCPYNNSFMRFYTLPSPFKPKEIMIRIEAYQTVVFYEIKYRLEDEEEVKQFIDILGKPTAFSIELNYGLLEVEALMV